MKRIYLFYILTALAVLTACGKNDPAASDSRILTDFPDGHEAVCLGIRSNDGRLLGWATMNLGASFPEDAGGLFAWGELEAEKSAYPAPYYYTENSAKNASDSLLMKFSEAAGFDGHILQYPSYLDRGKAISEGTEQTTDGTQLILCQEYDKRYHRVYRQIHPALTSPIVQMKKIE